MDNRIVYTYDQYSIDVDRLIDMINTKYPNRTFYVVGIFRGSLPLAVSLSNKLDTEMGIIKFQSYGGKSDKFAELIEFNPQENDVILVVDDIFDSGNTLKKVQDSVHSYYSDTVASALPDILYITLFSSDMNNDFTHISIHSKADEWIIFPWE